jgi:hypothetical protein
MHFAKNVPRIVFNLISMKVLFALYLSDIQLELRGIFASMLALFFCAKLNPKAVS